jgi:L-fuculose-phosphate aldolase
MTRKEKMTIDELGLRQQLLDTSRQLLEHGLNRCTSGNVSARYSDGFFITPSALPPFSMTPDSMVYQDQEGNVPYGGNPSSEWRFHRDIFSSRSEIGAIIHTHSIFATTIACLGKDVPPVHYMIAMAGGDNIRCTPYSLFGGQDLSDRALEALRDRKACLLGNHGMIALGTDLADALAVAVEVEFICEVYWRALQAGEPHILTAQQMHEVKQKFVDYKKRS